MAYDFVAIHVYVGNDNGVPGVQQQINEHLPTAGYAPVAESLLAPYQPTSNLGGQATRSLYLRQRGGWVSVVDEDGFRLDEATAEAMLCALSQAGPAILLWCIDQYVWGYTFARNGIIADRYTEDWIEFEAYNPAFLHNGNYSVEEQQARYQSKPDALADLAASIGINDPDTIQNLKSKIQNYRSFFRKTLDNENDYMDALISGPGEIYADSWAQEVAAGLGIAEPDTTYLDLVRGEVAGLADGWQPLTFSRPPQHQPAYSVGLSLYCHKRLTYQQMVNLILLVTQTLPQGGSGWNELELLGTYYKDEGELIDGLLHNDLDPGDRLNARYYAGCNLTIRRADDDVPLDLVLLEYPSIFDDQYTADVMERAFEVQALYDFVQSPRLSQLASDLFVAAKADYGYVSVLGGGAGGDGGGRVNVPGMLLREATAQATSQLLTRVGAKEAASWRSRWHRAGEAARGIYWLNLLNPERLGEERTQEIVAAAPGFPVLHASSLSLQLPTSLRDYADRTPESSTTIEQLRPAMTSLLKEAS